MNSDPGKHSQCTRRVVLLERHDFMVTQGSKFQKATKDPVQIAYTGPALQKLLNKTQ